MLLVRVFAELLAGGTVVIMVAVAVAVGGRGRASQGVVVASCVGNSDTLSSVEQGMGLCWSGTVHISG